MSKNDIVGNFGEMVGYVLPKFIHYDTHLDIVIHSYNEDFTRLGQPNIAQSAGSLWSGLLDITLNNLMVTLP